MGVEFNEEQMEPLLSMMIVYTDLNEDISNAVLNNAHYTMDLSPEKREDLLELIYIEAKREQKKRRQHHLDSLYIMIKNEIYDEIQPLSRSIKTSSLRPRAMGGTAA
ncbi:MAG: hypothetical protein DRP93_02815 [Candidatus Neomarinimicrobiota bacterium]|nr:MAG: hypothetical protein DRP93_02815 [Candidatus Neomarinimicrobiota bacterium]